MDHFFILSVYTYVVHPILNLPYYEFPPILLMYLSLDLASPKHFDMIFGYSPDLLQAPAFANTKHPFLVFVIVIQ